MGGGGTFNAQIGRYEIDNSNFVGYFGYNYTNGQLGTIDVSEINMSYIDLVNICKIENTSEKD